MIWLLVLALSVFAAGHTVRLVLGPLHLHGGSSGQAAAEPNPHAFSHAHGSAVERSAGRRAGLHGGLLRHHHALLDDTVVALEAAATDDTATGLSAAGATAGMGAALLPAGWQIATPPSQRRAWPHAMQATLRQAFLRLPERPPRG